MTILLTGTTGFLGSHLLKTLVNKGYKVVVLALPPICGV
ncbi:NAD-dependent epimerase/dehydratase family protein [Capnocytophaga sputigena]